MLFSLPPHQSLLVIEAIVHSPGYQSGLVVKNIILRQRAAVHMADGALGVLSARGNKAVRRLSGRLRCRPPAAGAIRLPMEVVQVLWDAKAGGVQKELRQEVARRR